MVTIVRDRVQALIAQGKTLEQIRRRSRRSTTTRGTALPRGRRRRARSWPRCTRACAQLQRKDPDDGGPGTLQDWCSAARGPHVRSLKTCTTWRHQCVAVALRRRPGHHAAKARGAGHRRGARRPASREGRAHQGARQGARGQSRRRFARSRGHRLLCRRATSPIRRAAIRWSICCTATADATTRSPAGWPSFPRAPTGWPPRRASAS